MPASPHTNAGQLTPGNTGLSERAAAILDVNIEAAASALARIHIARYDAQRARAEQARQAAAAGCGGATVRREQTQDRLSRMIAPGGSSLMNPAVGNVSAAAAVPMTPPPTAGEVKARESRRSAFLDEGEATGGSVLKAARPTDRRRAAAAAFARSSSAEDHEPPFTADWAMELQHRHFNLKLPSPAGSPTAATASAATWTRSSSPRSSSSASVSPAGSPRVQPMLTTIGGKMVYIAAEPMDLPSSTGLSF